MLNDTHKVKHTKICQDNKNDNKSTNWESSQETNIIPVIKFYNDYYTCMRYHAINQSEEN